LSFALARALGIVAILVQPMTCQRPDDAMLSFAMVENKSDGQIEAELHRTAVLSKLRLKYWSRVRKPFGNSEMAGNSATIQLIAERYLTTSGQSEWGTTSSIRSTDSKLPLIPMNRGRRTELQNRFGPSRWIPKT
jgi:hypothetical protein